MTQPTVTPYKQLRRPTDDRIVAGVCSGVGRYLGVDPVLVRVGLAVLAVITWGTALIAYPVMWFLMPEEPRPAQPAWTDPADPSWGAPAPQAYTPPFTPAPVPAPDAYEPPVAYEPPASPLAGDVPPAKPAGPTSAPPAA